MNIFQGHANKKYQKKVIKLIDATNKASLYDLELFMAIIMIRFVKNDSANDENSHFSRACNLCNQLQLNDDINNLIKK